MRSMDRFSLQEGNRRLASHASNSHKRIREALSCTQHNCMQSVPGPGLQYVGASGSALQKPHAHVAASSGQHSSWGGGSQHLEGPQGTNVAVPSERHALSLQNSPFGQQSLSFSGQQSPSRPGGPTHLMTAASVM
jgi:hypothetical protein